MRLAVVLVALSIAVLIAMIFQAVRQELKLSNLKTHMVEKSAEVKRKEETIIEVKKKVKELKMALTSVNQKIEELKKKKSGFEKTEQELDQSLQACNTEKARDTQSVFGYQLSIHCSISCSNSNIGGCHISGCKH